MRYPTSIPVISKLMVCDLWASSGDEMVKFALESLFKIYTNFYFSTAAIINALPRGSVAKYYPFYIIIFYIIKHIFFIYYNS
jgi:hypothetical protein